MSHRDSGSRRRDRDPSAKRFDSRRVIKSVDIIFTSAHTAAVLLRALLPRSSCQDAQIGLFRKLLAGCSFTVGVVTSCWKVASLELAFASVAGCRRRMTAHLGGSGTQPRSPARRSAAGCGYGIVIGERPLRQPSAELPGHCDDDGLGSADVTQPVASCCRTGHGKPLGSVAHRLFC